MQVDVSRVIVSFNVYTNCSQYNTKAIHKRLIYLLNMNPPDVYVAKSVSNRRATSCSDRTSFLLLFIPILRNLFEREFSRLFFFFSL